LKEKIRTPRIKKEKTFQTK